MNKVKVKQGTLTWERLRNNRIGSSEVFDIVRYYASDDELQNCGINAENFRNEAPYTTAWALYHKMLNDGIFKREELPPEYAEYGHAVEPYGVRVLRQGRKNKLIPGEVYADDRMIASLDITGIAEDVDTVKPFNYGFGYPKKGQKFVCEQKSMLPKIVKNGVPFKYIIQAQYQILKTKADFYILQIMILKDDTVFNRGKICQMSPAKRYKYLDDNMDVMHLYFQNNVQLACLIETCLDRFFEDVDNRNEPTPFISDDSMRNIMQSIWLNSSFDGKKRLDWKLEEYAYIKSEIDTLEKRRKEELQRIVELAMKNNACMFTSEPGYTAKFSKDGKFLIKEPEVAKCS